MTSQQEQKNDLVFLGINFNNFFKNCGCVQRSGDDEGILNDEDNKNALPILKTQNPPARTKSPAKNKEDSFSVASSTDWTDLEEIVLPTPASGGIFGGPPDTNGNLADEFFTQDPIDFESLKEVTGVEKDDEEKSSKSGLSTSSKKIAKKDAAEKETKGKGKGKGKEKESKKEAKGKRNPWQPHEDAKVMELVAKYGQSWAVVASFMEGRTGKQIRDRYLNKLRANIRQGDWSPEEDKLLLTLYYQLGHKWSKIATYLPGRTEGQVKNRFYSHIKKRITGHETSDLSIGMDSLQSPDSNYGGTNKQMHGIVDHREFIQNGGIVISPTNRYSDDFVKDAVSPSGSNRTATTQLSRISNEGQVNQILDKLTGYLDSKPSPAPSTESDLMGVAMGDSRNNSYQLGYNNNGNGNGNGNGYSQGGVDNTRFDQLKHRKDQLEYLLAQTMREMGTMQQAQNNQQGIMWGGWN